MSGTIDDVIVLGDSSDDEEIAQPSSTGFTGTFRYGVYTSAGPPVPMQLLTNQAAMPGIKMEVDEEEPSIAQRRGQEQASQVIVTGATEAPVDSQPSNPDVEEESETNWIQGFSLKQEPGQEFDQSPGGSAQAGQEILGTVFPQIPTSSFPPVVGGQQCEFSPFQQMSVTPGFSDTSPKQLSAASRDSVDLKPLVCPIPHSIYMNTHSVGGLGEDRKNPLDSQNQTNFRENAESTTCSSAESMLTRANQNAESAAIEQTLPDSSLSNLGEKSYETSGFASDLGRQDSEKESGGASAGTGDKRSEAEASQKTNTSPTGHKMVCLRCHRVFFSKTVFERHMDNCKLTATDEDPGTDSTSPGADYSKKGSYYQCKKCQFRSHHKETVVHHTRSNHQPRSKLSHNAKKGQFRCTICKREMDTYRLLMSHKAIAHRAPISVGDQQKAKKKAIQLKLKHVSRKQKSASNSADNSDDSEDDVESLQCELCAFRANSKFQADRHKSLHENPNVCYCPICKRPFKNEYLIKLHCDKVHKHSQKRENVKTQKPGPSESTDCGRPRRPRLDYKPKNNTPDSTDSQMKFIKKCKLRSGHFFCPNCSYKCEHKASDFKRHLETKRHILITEAKWLVKVGGWHKCKVCNYQTLKKEKMQVHLETKRHKHLLKQCYEKLKNPMGPEIDTQSESSMTGKVTSKDKGKKLSTNENIKLEQKHSTPSSAVGKRQQKSPSPNVSQIKKMKTSPKVIAQPTGTLAVAAEKTSTSVLGTKTVTLEYDLAEFAQRPFACSLCFFRTGHLEDLRQHVQNHLTGGNSKKEEESVTTSGILETGRTPITPISEIGTLSLPQYPATQRAHVGKSGSSSQSLNLPQMSLQRQQHYEHLAQSSDSPSSGYVMRPSHMPYPPSQVSSSSLSPSPYNMMSANMPHFPPPSIPPHSMQINTEDLLDLGNDFAKDPGNFEPYTCLYDRRSFKNLASLVNHFEMAHPDMLQLKSQQARMRAEAALSARAQSQSWLRGRHNETDIKVEVID